VVTGSYSIPFAYKPISYYYDFGTDKISFDGDETKINGYIYDGGVSTDFAITSTYEDSLINETLIDKLIVFDVGNYYETYNKPSENVKAGFFGTISGLINQLDNYVKYNDLLNMTCYMQDNPDNGDNEDNYVKIKKIMLTENLDINTSKIQYVKKRMINVNVKEIIYIGTDYFGKTTDIFNDQDKLKNIIKNQYIKGYEVGKQIYTMIDE
jgi:hypothetical protein